MGDPREMVPYHDPHDASDVNTNFIHDPNFIIHDTSNPSLANFPNVDLPSSASFPPILTGDAYNDNTADIANTNDQIDDPLGHLYDPALMKIIGQWEGLGIDSPSSLIMQWVEQTFGGENVEGASSSLISAMPDHVWPSVQAGGQTSVGGNLEGTSSSQMPFPVMPPVQVTGQTYDGLSVEGPPAYDGLSVEGPPCDVGVPTPVVQQASSPPPFQCSNNCQVLREILHTDGDRRTKLTIHGTVGVIYHAILEYENFGSSVPRYQMMDLSNKSLVDIKQFLQHYCDSRSTEGWVMLTDPLSAYYEALSAGLDWLDDMSGDESDPSETNSGDGRTDHTEGEIESERRAARSHLARQRKRTAKMTLRDLDDVFHLPIEEAAKQMSLCTTVLKRICRKYNMGRWPQRKVQSIRRKIETQRAKLNSNDSKERANAEAEIHRLHKELDFVTKRVNAERANADADN